jgi:hypothetical protein
VEQEQEPKEIQVLKHTIYNDATLQKLKGELKTAKAQADALVISDAESKSKASDMLRVFKKTIKDLDERRLDFFRPYEDAKKQIKAEIDVTVDPAKLGIEIIEKKLNDFLNAERIAQEKAIKEEQERIRVENEEKLAKIQEAQQGSGVDMSDVMEAQVAEMARQMEHVEQDVLNTGRAKGTISTTSQRFIMDAEIYDIFKFLAWVGKDPESRWNLVKPNEPAIKALMKAKGIEKEGEWENGIKTFKKPVLTTR